MIIKDIQWKFILRTNNEEICWILYTSQLKFDIFCKQDGQHETIDINRETLNFFD